MMFKKRNIISIRDFSIDDIEYIFKVSNKMLPFAKGLKKTNIMKNKILATLFYEPSTRTRLSFETAMLRLGGQKLGFATPKIASVEKGENLVDTIRMVENYADIIVLRHPCEGATRMAAEISHVPVINAGDGSGEHPTQTLLDLFTIKNELGKISGLNIVLYGDLKYSRTIHSLVYALSLYDVNMYFVSPPELEISKEILSYLKAKNIIYKKYSSLDKIISDIDVLYVTRIQKERFPDISDYLKVAKSYKVDSSMLQNVKENFVIMHPLPKVDEIAKEIDSTKYAIYYKQAFYSIPVRMAILGLVSGSLK